MFLHLHASLHAATSCYSNTLNAPLDSVKGAAYLDKNQAFLKITQIN
jgi:hypothetical protein